MLESVEDRMCSWATQRGMAVCASNEHSRFHWSGRGFSSAQLCNCSTWVGEGVVRRKREGFPSVQCNGAQGPLILCTSSEGLKGRVRKAPPTSSTLPWREFLTLVATFDLGGACCLGGGSEGLPPHDARTHSQHHVACLHFQRVSQ